MRRILIATDFSPHATRAAEHGAAFARLFGAEVELLTSVFLPAMALYPGSIALPEGYLQQLREQTRERLEALARKLRAEGLQVGCVVASEDASASIGVRARESGADLVAMGTRGRSGLPHVLFGSVAERTARLAPCPVLTAHADSPAPGPLRKILVPTDFSEHADAALEWVHPLAQKTGAHLILLHSYHLPRGLEPAALATDESIAEAVTADVERRLEAFRRAAPGCEAQFVLRRDHPDVAALELARQQAVDLIAIGSRGRTGLAHVVLGSTAERIIRGSRVPVVSMHAGG